MTALDQYIDGADSPNIYKIETPIITLDAKWGRKAYIKFGDDVVEFDDSGGEYGPVSFSIEKLEEMLAIHKQKLKENGN